MSSCNCGRMPASLVAPGQTVSSVVHFSTKHTPRTLHAFSFGSSNRSKRRTRVLILSASSSGDSLRRFGYGQDFESRYDLKEKVGSGSFGTVYRVTSKHTGEDFAVKSIAKRWAPGSFMEPLFVRRIQHEVDIYNHIGRSLNVAYLYGAYEDSKNVMLVMELCKGGELWKRVRSVRYSEKDAARSVREILRTVAQCHARNVLIRDVKPENFLYLSKDEDAPLKAIDFGMAQYCKPHESLRDKAGTAIYIAPEVLKMKYSLPSDLWSAGVMAYQLVTGRLPFSGEEGEEVSTLYMQTQRFEHKEVFRAVLYSDLDFTRAPWDTVSPECKDLVESLLQRDPTKRPTAAEALKHSWLSYTAEVASDAPLGGDIVQRLQRFGTYGRLKQIALRKVAHNIAGDSAVLADIKAAFQKLDSHGTGSIKYEDAQHALEQGGFNLSRPELQQLVSQLVDEMDDSGEIKYDNWVAAMVDWREIEHSQEWHDWVQKAFDAFDVDGSGSIGMQDLQNMLCQGGICAVPDAVEAAIREADVLDKDGNISLAEFEALMHSADTDVLDLFDTRHHT
ncbi:hypothetical protein ABBQ38_000531 [Trebouxia sp. C0009 RCD-2024]